jgi:hypothetical protein
MYPTKEQRVERMSSKPMVTQAGKPSPRAAEGKGTAVDNPKPRRAADTVAPASVHLAQRTRVNEAADFVGAALAAPGHSLHGQTLYDHLRVDVRAVSAVHRAVMNADVEWAVGFARAVLAAPMQKLSHELQARLLRSPTVVECMLDWFCKRDETGPLSQHEQAVHGCIRAYVREVASSPKWKVDDLRYILGLPGVIEAALASRNPGAAASILLGILESTANPRCKIALAPDVLVVARKLELLGATADEAWAGPLARELLQADEPVFEARLRARVAQYPKE